METQKIEKKRNSFLMRVAFYLLAAVLIMLFFCPVCFLELNVNLFRGLVFSFVLFFVLAEGNGALMQWMNKVYPWDKNPKKRFYISLLVIQAFSIPIIILVNVVFWIYLLGRPLNYIFTGAFYADIIPSVLITVIISLALFSLEFLDRWQKNAELLQRKKNKELYAQIESLQNQIKPHFLFNNLNAVTSIIPTDPDTAIKFINQLSKVYRYILDHQQSEIVGLETELNFAKSYVYLLEIRYGNKLQVQWDVEDLTGNLPPYTLQLLIENAVKHNVISNKKPLHVLIKRKDNWLAISNNLQVKAAEGASWGIGLQNIKDRFEILANKQVIVEKSDTEFIVEVPLLTIEK